MRWEWIILLIIILGIIIRVKIRGYFWKDKQGNHLSLKQFLKRWKSGIIESTPLQQTKISLLAFLPIIAGLAWGIVITFLSKTYWLTLILIGSMPITLIQVLATYQKYKRLKIIDDEMRKMQEENKKTKIRKKKDGVL